MSATAKLSTAESDSWFADKDEPVIMVEHASSSMYSTVLRMTVADAIQLRDGLTAVITEHEDVIGRG